MPHPGIPPQPRTASAQWRPAVQVAIGKSARYSPFRRRLAGPRAYAADRRLAGRKLASSLLRENVFRSADSSTHCQQAGIARRSRAPGGPSGNPERFRLASAVTLSVLYETSTPRLRRGPPRRYIVPGQRADPAIAQVNDCGSPTIRPPRGSCVLDPAQPRRHLVRRGRVRAGCRGRRARRAAGAGLTAWMPSRAVDGQLGSPASQPGSPMSRWRTRNRSRSGSQYQ